MGGLLTINIFKSAFELLQKIKETVNIGSIEKLVRGINSFSLLLLFFVYFFGYWNIILLLNLPVPPLFPYPFRNILYLYICPVQIAYFLTPAFFYFLLWLRSQIPKKADRKIRYSEKDFLSFFLTAKDITQLIFGIAFFLYILNKLIECLNGYSYVIFDRTFFGTSIALSVNFIFRLFSWSFTKNLNYFKKQSRRYEGNTAYFDSKNQLIREKDYVSFQKKMFTVEFDASEKSWYLEPYPHSSVTQRIKLQDAVNNEDGNLMIYKFPS